MWLLYHYCVSSDIPEGTVLLFTYLTYKQALFTVYREHLYILPTLLLTEIDIWFRFLSIPFSTLIFPTARTAIFLWTWNNTVAQSQNRFDSKHPVKCLLGQYVSSLFFWRFFRSLSRKKTLVRCVMLMTLIFSSMFLYFLIFNMVFSFVITRFISFFPMST